MFNLKSFALLAAIATSASLGSASTAQADVVVGKIDTLKVNSRSSQAGVAITMEGYASMCAEYDAGAHAVLPTSMVAYPQVLSALTAAKLSGRRVEIRTYAAGNISSKICYIESVEIR